MKKFIAIPGHFKGVSDSTDNLIYPAIIDRNAAGFGVCYKKANDLFIKLDKIQDQFRVSSYFFMSCSSLLTHDVM